MNLIHADIFFFITSIAVIVVAVTLVVALIYAIRILRDVKDISRTVKTEGEAIVGDVRLLRGELKIHGTWLKELFPSLLRSFLNIFSFPLKKSRKRRSPSYTYKDNGIEKEE